MNKDKGLYKKYEVTRVDGKPMEGCIVLEFNDKLAREAIHKWSVDMYLAGNTKVFEDVQKELLKYENN